MTLFQDERDKREREKREAEERKRKLEDEEGKSLKAIRGPVECRH